MKVPSPASVLSAHRLGVLAAIHQGENMVQIDPPIHPAAEIAYRAIQDRVLKRIQKK